MFSDLKPLFERSVKSPPGIGFHPFRAVLWTSLTLVLLWAWPADAQEFLANGHYVGDGTASRAIIEIGFQPDLVIVKGNALREAYIRTATMPADHSRSLGGGGVLSGTGINSLDADGFTIGDNQSVNEIGLDYY